MLLPHVADGMATYFFDMADVIAIVADGIATWLGCVQEDLIALVADGKVTGSIYFSFSSFLVNKNVGKYNLHHIWDRFLFNTPDL